MPETAGDLEALKPKKTFVEYVLGAPRRDAGAGDAPHPPAGTFSPF